MTKWPDLPCDLHLRFLASLLQKLIVSGILHMCAGMHISDTKNSVVFAGRPISATGFSQLDT